MSQYPQYCFECPEHPQLKLLHSYSLVPALADDPLLATVRVRMKCNELGCPFEKVLEAVVTYWVTLEKVLPDGCESIELEPIIPGRCGQLESKVTPNDQSPGARIHCVICGEQVSTDGWWSGSTAEDQVTVHHKSRSLMPQWMPLCGQACAMRWASRKLGELG